MHTTTLAEPRTTARRRLRMFTLYADFPAGIRARRLGNQVAGLVGSRWETSAEMWKLDSVAPVGPIRDMIAQEAGESDVLMIAISSLDQPDTSVIRWLHSLVNWKSNRLVPGLLVGLLGDEEHRVTDGNWAVNELAIFARRTQMDLAWCAVGRDAALDSDWLRAGLERLLAAKANANPDRIPTS